MHYAYPRSSPFAHIRNVDERTISHEKPARFHADFTAHSDTPEQSLCRSPPVAIAVPEVSVKPCRP